MLPPFQRSLRNRTACHWRKVVKLWKYDLFEGIVKKEWWDYFKKISQLQGWIVEIGLTIEISAISEVDMCNRLSCYCKCPLLVKQWNVCSTQYRIFWISSWAWKSFFLRYRLPFSLLNFSSKYFLLEENHHPYHFPFGKPGYNLTPQCSHQKFQNCHRCWSKKTRCHSWIWPNLDDCARCVLLEFLHELLLLRRKQKHIHLTLPFLRNLMNLQL